MRHLSKSLSFISVLALTTATLSPAARADINGFGDFSSISINQSDGNAAPTISPNTIHLTNNATGDVRSAFDNTEQNISQFTASFDFKAAGVPTNTSEFGACFVIQNDGPTNVATNNEGIPGTFGYQNWSTVFGRSIAVSLEYSSLSNNSSATAVYSDGALGAGAASTSPLNLFNGDPIAVTITYNGSILHENLVDTSTSASFDQYYVANIPSLVNGSSAYVGFTANTTNTSGSMDFSNLQFSSVAPEPCSATLLATAALWSLATRRRRSA